MKNRCYNSNQPNYRDYGARGIRVCDEWIDDVKAFILYCEENLPPRQPGETINRIDNDGNYEPGNIEWSSREEQNRNQRPHIHHNREYLLRDKNYKNRGLYRVRGCFTYDV